MAETILYSGAVAQTIRQGGLSWFHLQFLLGFRRLGHEVILVDRLDAGMCTDDRGEPTAFADSVQHRGFLDLVRRFGLEGSFSLDVDDGRQRLGLPRADLVGRARSAACLVNVMGYCHDPAVLAAVPRRVFLDIDPGFPQMWRSLGLHDAFAGHDRFATLARGIGRPDCTIPTCGLEWITLPQPVVLAEWPAALPRPEAAFTSIGAWRGPNGPVDFEGHRYGLRCHEFRTFLDVPGRCPGETFEQALEIHEGDRIDIEALAAHGWRLVSPAVVAGSPEAYRRFVQGSKAEFMVPKQMYVDTRGGLLSDRSAAYLASGRPVLARDTGLAGLYPLGEGLLAFSTPDEAAAGVAAIAADYPRHCRAARELAEATFDSDRVLARFLDDVLA
ncbi:MAG: hypothetical protein ACKO40_13385 [Planctomycetaceae bacterium]